MRNFVSDTFWGPSHRMHVGRSSTHSLYAHARLSNQACDTASVLRQVRQALRAGMGAAARAAARGPSQTLPRGSALLWSLLQECLRQQAEALIEQQSYKDAASDAMAQVWPG